ncbi:MAG: glycosyltransferase family 2 protein [Anaerolineae bacterium]
MSQLAIIIVSWNVKRLLADCLRSVFDDLAGDSRGLAAQVWVVDNASGDGSVEMVRRDFPAVKLLAGDTNLGFAGGNNAALRTMGFGENGAAVDELPAAVLLLNPDTLVQPGALLTLADFLAKQPRAGIAGARLQYGDGSFQHGAFAFPGLWQLAIDLLPLPGRLAESRLNGRYPREWYAQGQPFEIGHPLGAAMAVRREAILQAGLLDEAYHMYVEEVDWSRRITASGWKAYCVPAAVVTHLGGQSTGQIQTASLINLWRSRYRYYRRYIGGVRLAVARQIVRQGMRRKAGQDRANAQLSPTERGDRLAAYRQVIEIWQGKAE